VQAAPSGRLRMLEPIREYALEQLAQAGLEADARRRHARHFADFGLRAYDALIGPEQAAWHARIDAEQANIQAAIRWSLRDGEDLGGQALKIGYGIWRYWWQRGFWRDNLAHMQQAIALNGPDVVAIMRRADAAELTERLLRHAGAARGASYLAAGLNQFDEARVLLSHALNCAMQAEDDVMVARTYSGLGMVAKDAGDFGGALAYLEDGLRLWRRIDPAQLRFPQVLKASVLMRLGEIGPARALYATVLEACERAQDAEGTATALRGLAEAAWRQGAAAEAVALLERAISLCDGIGNKRGNAWAYHQLGNAMRVLGDHAAARVWLTRSLRETRAFGDESACLEILASVAELEAASGDYAQAARVLAGVAAGVRRLGVSLTPFELAEMDRCRQRCRARLSPAEHARAEREGALLALQQLNP
jgi:tetratricopeptide (TPR) repeat protein